MIYLELLFLLVFLHWVADYPLQGEFLANGKNHKESKYGYTNYHLVVHSGIHGGFVFLATNSLFLGLLELFLHTLIDYLKCDGKISYYQDQLLHIVCKVVWVVLVYLGWLSYV